MNVTRNITSFALHVAALTSVFKHLPMGIYDFSAITKLFFERSCLQAVLTTAFVVLQLIAWQKRRDPWSRVLRCLSIWFHIYGGIAALHGLVEGQFRTRQCCEIGNWWSCNELAVDKKKKLKCAAGAWWSSMVWLWTTCFVILFWSTVNVTRMYDSYRFRKFSWLVRCRSRLQYAPLRITLSLIPLRP